MKRGRPNVRHDVQRNILQLLREQPTPQTISLITRELSEDLNQKLSWNTVKKYMQELVEVGKIEAIQLPHSKNENDGGLTVYTLKR